MEIDIRSLFFGLLHSIYHKIVTSNNGI